MQIRVLGALVVHRETDVGSRLSAPTAGSVSCYTVIIGLLSIIEGPNGQKHIGVQFRALVL